mmetsp:Transcript_114759/g.329610  ORF Transcript_114759/g.329610 Transcript_114759/m.329610 type:complete len:483 (-) Transcript_114759:266-1714(-)
MDSRSEGLENSGVEPQRCRKEDVNLKVLLFSPIKDVASWLNRPDKQMPFLEEVSPRSSADMTPSTSVVSEVSLEDNIASTAPHASATPKDNDFDPFRDILNLFSPPRKPAVASSNKVNEANMLSSLKSKSTTTPCNSDTPKRLDFEIVDTKGLPPGSTVAPAEQEADKDFDPFRDILNLFSPSRKTAATSNKKNISGLKPTSTTTPSDPPKRLDFETVDGMGFSAGSTLAPVQREVATVQDLCKDTIKGLEQVVARAKQVNLKECLEKARQVDAHRLAESAKTATKNLESRVIKIVDTAKEIDPQQVLTQAKTTTKELTDAVRMNAQVHPLPWAVIGAVFFAIIFHVIFVGGSSGSPAMGFAMSFYGSRQMTSSSIVDRVASFLHTEMGEDAKHVIEGAKTTGTCDVMSGNDILAKLSESLHEPLDSEPGLVDAVVDQIELIREDPREYLRNLVSSSQGFVSNVLRQGRQLTTDAFYELTAL